MKQISNVKKLIVDSLMLVYSNRLDVVLTQECQGFSRSYFVRLLDLGLILVNGKVPGKAGQVLRQGDVIDVEFSEKMPTEVRPHKVDFKIIDQNVDFLVIDKPAGVLSHSTNEKNASNSLVNGLVFEFRNNCSDASGAQELFRAGLVHRLDQDTSGLMLVAKTIEAQNIFAKLFQERTIEKKYLAVVQGQTKEAGIINSPIGRHPKESHKWAVLGVAQKEAITEYKVKQFFGKCATLLEVKIGTGRTHQIRVHLNSIGHSIIGDGLYGQTSELITRQALHAYSLEFDFKGKRYFYLTPMPRDMEDLVKKLSEQ